MKTEKHWYNITGPGIRGGDLEVPRPETLPEAGDILFFTKNKIMMGPFEYSRGDEVHLMKRTDEAPWGKSSSLGNWKAISKHGVSIWSNVEWMIAANQLSYKKPRKRKQDAAK